MQRFSLTVTSKGQFTLPLEAREMMKVAPGDRLELFLARDGVAMLTPRNRAPSEVFGRASAYAKPVSDSDREATFAKDIAARGAPTRRKAG